MEIVGLPCGDCLPIERDMRYTVVLLSMHVFLGLREAPFCATQSSLDDFSMHWLAVSANVTCIPCRWFTECRMQLGCLSFFVRSTTVMKSRELMLLRQSSILRLAVALLQKLLFLTSMKPRLLVPTGKPSNMRSHSLIIPVRIC